MDYKSAAIDNRELLYTKKEYANPDYPVVAYFLDLGKLYLREVRWQWHDEVELVIINHGVAEISTDDSTLILTAGQAAVINRQVIHTIRTKGSDNCSLYSFSFHTDFILGKQDNSLKQEYVNNYHNNTFKLLPLDEQTPWQNQILEYINEVVAINLTKKYGYELQTKGYLTQLWATLITHLHQKEEQPERTIASVDELRVKQALNYIRANYSHQITLDDIAASIHISKSECCRCFKRTLQMTPFEYLMKFRIYEAARKICDKNAPISSMADLALSLGFNNISYFNKLFRKYIGSTPTQYKKNVMQNAQSVDPGMLRFTK